MPAPSGFTFVERKSGEIVIFHHGRPATTLRGRKREQFLRRLQEHDPQELMARATGNYKRGNERQA